MTTMVRATPAWQDVDAMWESDAAAEWERLNEPDQYEKQLKSSAEFIKQAYELLDKAEDRLAEAMAELSETPMEYKIGSFFDQVSDMRCDLNAIAEKYERGERD